MTALPLQIYHFLPTAFKNVLIGYTIKVAICLQEIEKCIHSPLPHIRFSNSFCKKCFYFKIYFKFKMIYIKKVYNDCIQ